MNLKLLIVFLMLPFCGKAQIVLDSVISGGWHEPLDIYNGTLRVTTSNQFDTVRCIMLVCDIGLKEYQANTIDMTYKTYKDFDYSVKWQIGYVYHTDGFHVEYLDENKKPLSKNIIVWMSKNTEQ